jgi:hypothetical protein
MELMNYSPLPLQSYRLTGVANDHVTMVLSTPYPDPIWNLIWMSLPTIDLVVGNKDWSKSFHYPPGALAALAKDVIEDEVLRAKLTRPPLDFANWFSSEDHSIFDTYPILGPAWPATVVARAHVAHANLESIKPQVQGNVIRVQFGRKA